LRSLGRAALGTRRPLQVAVGDAVLEAATALDASSAAALRVSFSLPAGCFATALCRELQSGPGGHDGAGTPAEAS
jgi:tRNA(Glu) U13 pseudouridine synthase TruD